MSENSKAIVLAKWSDRFWAWLIDFLLISISFGIGAIAAGVFTLEFSEEMFLTKNVRFVPTSLIFFLYWVALEYSTGQSVGKKAVGIKVKKVNGKKPTLKGVLVSSFGKSFLLPLDVVLGWILTNERRQRIFNKIGDTIVVKVERQEQPHSDVRYIKD